MYAVVKTGGKQYKVAKDDVILVEKLAADIGDEIQLDNIMLVDDGKEPKIGAPLIDGAAVKAKVVDQTRGKKIVVFKKKRRHNYRRKNGHRQDLTVLRITDILTSGAAAKQADEPKEYPNETPRKQTNTAPAEKPATNTAETTDKSVAGDGAKQAVTEKITAKQDQV